MRNEPSLWADKLPRPTPDGHKYQRGHALVLASDELTGATRLAAGACNRIGAGLVTVRSEHKGDLFRAVLPADMMVQDGDGASLKSLRVILAGSGGFTLWHKQQLLTDESEATWVLDAKAIKWWVGQRPMPREAILTPHDGEFSKAFPDLIGTRTERALEAAMASEAIVVLKGPETVIAAPDGRVVLNVHASPYLAKAGTGDVLAGMIAGLVTQGMEAFDAACAATWMHGEAARQFGPGLTASDLEGELPAVLSSLLG